MHFRQRIYQVTNWKSSISKSQIEGDMTAMKPNRGGYDGYEATNSNGKEILRLLYINDPFNPGEQPLPCSSSTRLPE